MNLVVCEKASSDSMDFSIALPSPPVSFDFPLLSSFIESHVPTTGALVRQIGFFAAAGSRHDVLPLDPVRWFN